MHILQQKILGLSKQMDISKMGLRQIGKLIGEEHPQKVAHHLGQLEKKGLVIRNRRTGKIKAIKYNNIKSGKLFSLPILGSANCGPACLLAQENIEGYLRVSSNMLPRKDSKGIFILKASGDSLNMAKSIKGGSVKDGDYVVIDSANRNPT